jgi:hypothetical protein
VPDAKKTIKIGDWSKKLGEIKISDTVFIVVQKVKFKSKNYIDIRKSVVTEKYEGFTSKGIMIPEEIFPEVLKVLDKVKL